MKVLLVAPFGGIPGGITRWTGHLMDYYDSLEQSDSISITLVPMGRTSFISINTPFFFRLKKGISDYLKIIKVFRRALLSSTYDVMHLASSASWGLLRDLFMLKKAQNNGIRTVVHFHFGRIPELQKKGNWEWRLLKKVVRNADRVVVLDVKSMAALNEIGCSSVRCIPNPLAPFVQAVVERNQTERISRQILFCGHVVQSKGIFELIDACAGIPDVQLKFVGHITDEMKTRIIDYCHDAKWLELVGELPYEGVIKMMMMSDILALPSYTEGFPNVILEGMAAGCAIIATNVGAIPQMLEEENNERYGVIIEPYDVKGLERAIVYLLENPDEKEAMSARAKVRVKERYSMEKTWGELVKIWGELAGNQILYE